MVASPDDRQQPVGLRPAHAALIAVHDDERRVVRGEVPRDGLPYPAVATDDEVRVQPVHLPPHRPSPENARELPADDELHHPPDAIQDRAHAADDE